MQSDSLNQSPAQKRTVGKSASKSRSQSTEESPIYQFKITLENVRPPIWRRVLVPGHFTLRQLHVVIQVAMDGWEGGHLHEFEIDEKHYAEMPPPGMDWGVPIVDEARVMLADVVQGEKTTFLYTYDFGDSWQHRILVEKILPLDVKITYPICLKGKRACPPEDCGGPWGYAELLEILADPTHPEYEERCEWLSEGFDAENFDIEGINSNLARIGES